jgi:hypothetical protein
MIEYIRKPSKRDRVAKLYEKIEALLKNKHRGLSMPLDIKGKLLDLMDENPIKEEDKRYEEIIKKLEEEISQLELEEDRKN